MADFNSSLPVRTENNGDIVAKISDGTTASQLLSIDSSGRVVVKLDDGSGNLITSQANGIQRALDVGINVAGVQIDPRSIRALTSADIVSVVQSTSPWITKDQADGPVAPGAAASFSELIGGVFNTTPPTLTNGQQAALQVDANGRLLTDANVLLSNDLNYGTVGANTLRTAAQIGNATGAASFNSGATGAQTLRVEANQGASATAANGWFIKPTDGTNNQAYLASGEAKVSVTQALPAGSNNIGSVNQGTSPWVENLSQVGGSAISLGQKTSAASLPVVIASDQSPIAVTISDIPAGTPVNDAKDASSIAAGSSDNHDYTVTTAKTLHLHQIEGSASGKAKFEVLVETGVATGVFTSRFVKFNSTANPNISVSLQDPISVAAGVRVRVIATNKDLLAQDLYSTISGQEV